MKKIIFRCTVLMAVILLAVILATLALYARRYLVSPPAPITDWDPPPRLFNPALWGDLYPGRDVVADTNQSLTIKLPEPDLYTFHINSQGFRGDEQTITDATRKVLLLGDGYAFGTGLDGKQDIASQLASMLNSDHRYKSTAVFNGGIPGYTINDELDYIREKGSLMRPELVIIIVAEDDVWETARPVLIRSADKKLTQNMLYALWFDLKWGSYRLFRFKESYLRMSGLTEQEALAKLIPVYLKLAKTFKNEVSRWSGKTLFILSGAGMDDTNKSLEVAMRKSELEYIYVSAPSGIPANLADGHWTADMCKYVAQQVKEWIEESAKTQFIRQPL